MTELFSQMEAAGATHCTGRTVTMKSLPSHPKQQSRCKCQHSSKVHGAFISRPRERSQCRKRSCHKHRVSAVEGLSPEDQQFLEQLAEEEVMDEIALEIDVGWSDMPLEKLRRAGEVGWDMDPDGPTGPEKFDNPYNKAQVALNREAIRQIGMGSWRVKQFVSPTLQLFVANLEAAWRHLIDNLGLYPMKPEYLYLDSMDPKHEYGDWSYADIESPQKGDPGWPRLQIENRCYQSREFRKLHMEVAHRQDGLEVLHCVMYPRLEYDLPILSLDVVAKDGFVSLGIIDPCLGNMDGSLPDPYQEMVSSLQNRCGVASNRAMPDWGRSIFSEHCVMMRPENPDALEAFMRYSVALSRLHLRYAHASQPVQETEAERMQSIKDAHKRYSVQHLKNSKTKRVLAAAFGDEAAEEYMTKVMFDTANI